MTQRKIAGALSRLWTGTVLFACASVCASAAEVKIGYLRGSRPKPALSLVQMPADNDGLAGAQLAINDNNTTGKFLDQQFSLENVRLADSDDAGKAARSLAERGIPFVIADLPADALLAAANQRNELLLFNASATDDRLREEDCRPNVVHT